MFVCLCLCVGIRLSLKGARRVTKRYVTDTKNTKKKEKKAEEKWKLEQSEAIKSNEVKQIRFNNTIIC